MKKLNNKGFLLVETIVVATFTVTVLVALFLQFKNLLINYNDSYKYNTVEGIYNLGAFKNCLQNSDFKEEKVKTTDNPPYIDVTDAGGVCQDIKKAGHFKQVILANSNLRTLKSYVRNTKDETLSEEMKDVIKKLDSADHQDRLIAEFTDGTYASLVYGVNNDN